MTGTAGADTLREALVSTYQTNPTLTGQRETLKATDATVAIARAAGRPQVSASVGINRNLTRSGVIAQTQGSDHNISLSGGVDLSLPLFRGGAVRNSVRAAQTRVEAGRATLRAVEGDVFTLAVAAYMDVILDRAIVELNQNNVKVLETNLEATSDRFKIGDLTRTDVAQSEARLQLGRSQLATAQGRLAASEATYRQVVGHQPGQLAPPPPLPPLPKSEDEAVRIALANNPDLIATSRQAMAAGYDVNVARAGRLPTLSGVASGDYLNQVTGSTNGLSRSGTATSVGLSATVPLFQGGLPAARIRQAQAQQGQALEQVVGTERAVVQAARSAFASYDAAQKAIQANTVAVQANELALEGNRAEQGVGTRTIIEVLNAEQELLQSQVALVTARRDAYVAGFQLLNAMGQAEAQDLGLDGGPLYDPLGNYRHVTGNWNDWASDPKHPTVATRTVSPEELPPNPIVTPELVPAPPATLGVTPPPQ
ncbi:MAG: TolC family outer membrane protein [Sphingomonas sp.]|nr:TolC family outer membrane protein [Sphingomonas sp.]